MSSISGVSSVASGTNPYLAGLSSMLPGNFGQTLKDFQAIGAALKSGDLTSAQTAFTALQKDFPAGFQAAVAQPFGANTKANTDFQTLTSALKTGDLTGAKKAFTSMQTDLQMNLTSATAGGSSFSSTLTHALSGLGISF